MALEELKKLTKNLLKNVAVGNFETAVAGREVTAISGIYGTSVVGFAGIAIAGDGGVVSAGERGTLILHYFDGVYRRVAVAYVGENGIKPNVKYELDENLNFVEVSEEDLETSLIG